MTTFFVFALVGLLIRYGVLPDHGLGLPLGFEQLIFFFPIVWLLDFYLRFVYPAHRPKLFWDQDELVQAQFRFLSIGSNMDEAWQLLNHVQSNANPLAVRTSLLSYLTSTIRSSFSQRASFDRIYYGPIGSRRRIWAALTYLFIFVFAWWSFLDMPLNVEKLITLAPADLLLSVILPMNVIAFVASMFLGFEAFAALSAPVRVSIRFFASLSGIFEGFGTYVVRRASWPVLQKLALGLEGYPYKPPAITRCPGDLSHIKCEELPKSAERLALENRSAWVARHIEDASLTFSKVAVTAADISLLMHSIEADQTLVHAAYYTDDACINRIAEWIAAKE